MSDDRCEWIFLKPKFYLVSALHETVSASMTFHSNPSALPGTPCLWAGVQQPLPTLHTHLQVASREPSGPSQRSR